MLSFVDQLAESGDETAAFGDATESSTSCSKDVEITLKLFEPLGERGEVGSEFPVYEPPPSSSFGRFLVGCVAVLWAISVPFVLVIGCVALWFW